VAPPPARTNLLVRELAILSYIKSQDLHGFIDGSIDPTPSTITTQAEGVTTASQNPAWLQWHMRDQLVLSILIDLVTHEKCCCACRQMHQYHCQSTVRG
jgi:hypothetical protein